MPAHGARCQTARQTPTPRARHPERRRQETAEPRLRCSFAPGHSWQPSVLCVNCRAPVMAPKGTAKDKAKAKAQMAKAMKNMATPTKTTPDPAKRATLLEKQMASQSSPSAALKQKVGQDASKLVTKIIYDNFRSFDDEQIYQLVRDGTTLFDRLCADKKRADDGQITMGKHYYATARSLYRRDSDPFQKIMPDRSLPKDDTLEEAIGNLGKHCADSSGLLAWLQREELPNQRCCCALAKVVLSLDPYVGPSRCEVLMSMLQWAYAVKFPEAHPELWQLVRSRFDQTLDRSWSLLKSTGVGSLAWWTSVQPHGTLLLDEASWEKCIRHSGDTWDDYTKELTVVMGSLVGSRMFQVPWKTVQAQVIDKIVRDSVATAWSNEKVISWEVLKAKRAELASALKAKGTDLYSTFKPRQVEVVYRGVKFPIMVSSYIDIHTCFMWAKIKETAVLMGLVEPLFCESALCPMGEAVWTGVLDKALLTETIASRTAMHSFVEDKAKATASEIQRALVKNNRALQALDKQWRIESNFYLSQVGKSGEERLQQLVLGKLPTEQQAVTLKDAKNSVKLLCECTLYQFVGVALQRSLTTLMHWLDLLIGSRPPNIPRTATDPFTSKLILAMANFARAKASNEGGGDEEVCGKEAVEVMFAKVAAAVQAHKSPSLESLRPLGMYKWLLAPKQQTQLKEWTASAMKGVEVEAPKKTAAHPNARKAPAAKKRKTDTEAAMEWADSLF